MKDKLYTLEEVVNVLRAVVGEWVTQEKFAEQAGVSQQYVGDILRGQRTPGKKILDALSMEKVIVYRRKEAKK